MSIQQAVNKRKLFFNFLTSFSLLLFEMRVIAGMPPSNWGDCIGSSARPPCRYNHTKQLCKNCFLMVGCGLGTVSIRIIVLETGLWFGKSNVDGTLKFITLKVQFLLLSCFHYVCPVFISSIWENIVLLYCIT